VSIDAKLAALGDALHAAGLPRPRTPQSSDALDDLVEVIAPLRLPEELRRFWELVDVGSLAFYRYPPIHNPDGAQCLWNQHLDHVGGVPHVLLPLGYESHAFVFVELHGPQDDMGGSLFSWGYGDTAFCYIGDSITNIIEQVTLALRRGWLEHDEDGDVRILPSPQGSGYLNDRLTEAPHPLFGDIASMPGQTRSWPPRWLTLSGIPLEHLKPAGADHTIAEALSALRHGHVQARVQGSVMQLAGTSENVSVTVSDGTAQMQILCPAAVTALGPTCPGRYEFAIVAAGPGVAPVSDQFPGDFLEPHAAALLEQYRGVLTDRPHAIATEVRPVDRPPAGPDPLFTPILRAQPPQPDSGD
jgi:hypothetical protein